MHSAVPQIQEHWSTIFQFNSLGSNITVLRSVWIKFNCWRINPRLKPLPQHKYFKLKHLSTIRLDINYHHKQLSQQTNILTFCLPRDIPRSRQVHHIIHNQIHEISPLKVHQAWTHDWTVLWKVETMGTIQIQLRKTSISCNLPITKTHKSWLLLSYYFWKPRGGSQPYP